MYVAIIGSRTVTDYEYVKSVLMDYIDTESDVIVSGGAKGADSFGERFANECCTNEPLIFLPEWDKYGTRAGYIRNKDIIANSEMVIAFHDGKSKGTLHSLKLSKEKKLLIHVFPDTKPESDEVFDL